MNTTQFAEAIIKNFGMKPAHNPKPDGTDIPSSCTVVNLQQNAMMESVEGDNEKIVGVDMFLESNVQPDVIAKKMPEAWWR